MSRHDQANLRFEKLERALMQVDSFFIEAVGLIKKRDPMLLRCLISGCGISLLILLKVDLVVFQLVRSQMWYPKSHWGLCLYDLVLPLLPMIALITVKMMRKRNFSNKLKEVFDIVGLKNPLGSYPRVICLQELTGETMKLSLSNGGFSLTEWLNRKEKLEAAMRVYIDEIESTTETGRIEITFSYEPMPSLVRLDNLKNFRDYRFLVGKDRHHSHICDFSTNPHLLIAGTTGGGKSAFLRQMITTIKVNHREAQFHLIDMKEGMEFGYLKNVPFTKVFIDLAAAKKGLEKVLAQIPIRVEALKKRGLNDIKLFFETTEYQKLSSKERALHPLGSRLFVVVDECAEIFLVGSQHKTKDAREIRVGLSRLARLGRAVGLHVVLATQRPDRHAVDPQIKSNMTSIICYRVPDLGASLTVLGSGRAMDLPKLPGRAVYKNGADELEIQTPFISLNDSIEILEKTFNVSLDQSLELPSSPETNINEVEGEEVGPPGPSHHTA